MPDKPRRSSPRNRGGTSPVRKTSEAFQCELSDNQGSARPERLRKMVRRGGMGKSRLLKFRKDFTWTDVSRKDYKIQAGDWQGVKRQELIGAPGDPTDFHVRYFEIEPGGFSSLEKHRHAHAVTAIRGQGRVVVGDNAYPLRFLDTIYIAPNTTHQLLNEGGEPFGFFCTVDAVRDRPKQVSTPEAKGKRKKAKGKSEK